MVEGISVSTSNVETVPEKFELDPCKTATTSGLFKAVPLNRTVYCEMTTFGGGWLVFQQRIIKEDRSQLIFNQGWDKYRTGFGTVGSDTEFWLGLEALHQITNSDEYELVIELKDKNEKYGYARYSQFKVAGEGDKYRLTVGGYSGSAGDALGTSNSMPFSTYDRRNYSPECENYWDGGWWFNTCDRLCAPNFGVGPYWFRFTYTENTANGIYSRMMIHRK
ncbi:fibrinogen-like protein A [Culex quinquefasciatus]|uniref:fibrinogen-like protein A n=1 Tax=Culex quinquefasciatus TaxID=7176 RepID=UPI0018E3B6CD|nr:fibrinogen-like protein A [Culex quinquefasciatus]